MTSPEWEAANEDDSDRFPQTPQESAPESTESHELGSQVVPDPARDAQPTLAHPLPDGVSDTFINPCLRCGTTIQVVNGQVEPHDPPVLQPDESPAAYAWWQGFMAAKAQHAPKANVPAGVPARDSQPSSPHEAPTPLVDPLQSDPARVARYAEAIYAEGAYCGDCEYLGWDECSQCRAVTLGYAKAAIALADEERAALVAELKQVRKQWHQEVENFERETLRAEAAEAKVAKVEALADKWDAESSKTAVGIIKHGCATELRAALADAPAEQREPECDMTEDGKHADGGIDPDWNEQICAACHDTYEPAEGDGRG